MNDEKILNGLIRFGLLTNLGMIALGICLIVAGCDKKVTPIEKAAISTASEAAKERAAAFALIGSGLVAKNPADAEALKVLVAAHQDGLNKHAATLKTFVDSIDSNGRISQQGIDTIASMSENAKVWHQDAAALKPNLTLTTQQEAWFDAHIAALEGQANKLDEFLKNQRPQAPPKEQQ